MDTVVVVVAAVRIQAMRTIIIPKQQGDQHEFWHEVEHGVTLSHLGERQLLSMVGISMPHATQFFMEAKLTFILGLLFILLTIPEVLM